MLTEYHLSHSLSHKLVHISSQPAQVTDTLVPRCVVLADGDRSSCNQLAAVIAFLNLVCVCVCVHDCIGNAP